MNGCPQAVPVRDDRHIVQTGHGSDPQQLRYASAPFRIGLNHRESSRLQISFHLPSAVKVLARGVPRQNSDLRANQIDSSVSGFAGSSVSNWVMLRLLRLLFVVVARCFHSRRDLLLENLALRQQLGVLKGRHPQIRFAVPDKAFWLALHRFWPDWRRALILVQPETVVGWHRAGFTLYLCLAKMSSARNRAQSLTVKTALGSCASPKFNVVPR